MILTIDKENLTLFLRNFYLITGIRTAIFDSNFNEIFSYPSHLNEICKRIRSTKEGFGLCHICDESGKLGIAGKENYIYSCHSGLVDAIAPITDQEDTIGYIMIGQCLSDDMSVEDAWERTTSLCSAFTDLSDLKEAFFAIPRFSYERLLACADLMSACASYVCIKNYIILKQDSLFSAIKEYITTHLAGNLSSEKLSEALLVPRNKLFQVIKEETSMTLGQYIQHHRLENACKLLKTTGRSISQIACECGIEDFNYFARLFKKQYGIAPREFRKTLSTKTSDK